MVINQCMLKTENSIEMITTRPAIVKANGRTPEADEVVEAGLSLRFWAPGYATASSVTLLYEAEASEYDEAVEASASSAYPLVEVCTTLSALL